jgi:hypothetical protein
MKQVPDHGWCCHAQFAEAPAGFNKAVKPVCLVYHRFQRLSLGATKDYVWPCPFKLTNSPTFADFLVPDCFCIRFFSRDKYVGRTCELEQREEPGCIYTIAYGTWLNTIEYGKSESTNLTFL